MPLEQFMMSPRHIWGRWRIAETEAQLRSQLSPVEQLPETLRHPAKRLEYLAARTLIQTLLQKQGLNFMGIAKNEFGKPSLLGFSRSVSLSHSFPYVAAIIGDGSPVGVDLEQPKQKLLRVAHRVLHPEELHDAGDDLVKHCIYWCAKESMVKIHGKKDLIFAQNLRIGPFQIASRGEILGRIIANSTETPIPLQYFVEPDFVMVVNK